jgi:hypothetical protein
VSPADSFGTAIGIGIGINVGIGIGIELTNPLSAKLLADRVATLSELREHGHTTIMTEWHRAFSLSIPIPIPTPTPTPTPIALRRCLDSVV